MNNAERMTWISGATYHELLQKWRHAPVGDTSWFDGNVGAFFSLSMGRARDKLSHDQQVRVSKSVGWAK